MPTADDDPARHLELAGDAVHVMDVDAAVAHLSAAIRGFTAAGTPRPAAMACAQLGELYANALGNLTAARAWFARATRLVENEEPCIEQGWVAVAPMGCDVDDPAVLLARAELALDRARRFGDVNLETKALADGGLAHVQAGRVAEGMALLDEAMALASAQADDLDAAGKSVCSFFTACYFTADFERAASWASIFRKRGLIGSTGVVPMFLSSHCDSVHATLLYELGQWSDAEALLVRAMEDFEASLHMPSWHPAIALADLRIRQGRLADAEMLLLGKDSSLQALLPAARLHLARGDIGLARAAAGRGLRAVGADRLRAAELLTVLVDVELAEGNIDGAVAAAAELDVRASGLDCPALVARALAARARVQAATGQLSDAIGMVEQGVNVLTDTGAPWLRALLLLELARLYDQVGDIAAASVEAKAAAGALAQLDVVLPAADRSLLERLGVEVRDDPTGLVVTATLTREPGRMWAAACGDLRVPVADTKGMRYLAELLANPGVERHALDLVDRIEGVEPDAASDRRRLGDAGEMMDGRARAAYRHRIEVLRAEIDEALDAAQEARAEALQGELDQLVGQLAEAFGLGGRARRASSASERARLNVTRALRAATAKLADVLPGPGQALDRGIRTGLYCAYEPADTEVRWIVQR